MRCGGRSCRLDLPARVRQFSSTRLLRVSPLLTSSRRRLALPNLSQLVRSPDLPRRRTSRLGSRSVPPRLLIHAGLLSHVAPLIRSGASESGASVRTLLSPPCPPSPSLVSPFIASVLAAASLPSHARSVRPSSLLFSPRSSTLSPARLRPSFRGLHPPRTRRLQSPTPLQRPRHPSKIPTMRLSILLASALALLPSAFASHAPATSPSHSDLARRSPSLESRAAVQCPALPFKGPLVQAGTYAATSGAVESVDWSRVDVAFWFCASTFASLCALGRTQASADAEN